MALSETAKLVVDLSLKGNFVGQIGKASKGLDTFDRKATRAYRAGQQIGTGIKNGAVVAAAGIGILASQVALGLRSLVDLEKATAQTGAVIKSTGGVAGVTGAEVTRLAEKFEGLNAQVGDEFIRAGQNMLLTFTNIRGKAFEPALEAVLNLNTAMGKGPEGLTKTAILVGKALNDPAKGLTALTRVGVAFDKKQIARIKSLQKEGKLYEAQQIILKELGKEFGGSFAAQGDTAAGKVAKFNDSIDDLQRSLATALLPAVGNVADALTELLADPELQKGVEDLGKEIGKLFSKGNIKAGAKALGDAFQAIKSAAPAIKSALGTVGSVLKGAFDAFNSLPAPVQQLLIGGAVANKLTGGLVTNIAGGIFGALKAMTVQAGVVNVMGASVGGGGVPGAAGKGLSGAAKMFLVGEAIGLALLVNEVRTGISEQNTEIARGLSNTTKAFLDSKPDAAAITSALAGVNQGITDLQSNPLNAIVQGDALIELRKMRAALIAQQIATGTGVTPNDREDRKPVAEVIDQLRIAQAKNIERLKAETKLVALQVDRKGERTVESVNDNKTTVAAAMAAAATTTSSQTRTSGVVNAQATRSGSASVVGAIYANRPIISTTVNVNATTVTKTYTVKERYGPSGGSRNQNSTGSGTIGNGGR